MRLRALQRLLLHSQHDLRASVSCCGIAPALGILIITPSDHNHVHSLWRAIHALKHTKRLQGRSKRCRCEGRGLGAIGASLPGRIVWPTTPHGRAHGLAAGVAAARNGQKRRLDNAVFCCWPARTKSFCCYCTCAKQQQQCLQRRFRRQQSKLTYVKLLSESKKKGH